MPVKRIRLPRIKKPTLIQVIDPIVGCNTAIKTMAAGQLNGFDPEVKYKNKRNLRGKPKWIIVYTIGTIGSYAGQVLHFIEINDAFVTKQKNIYEAETEKEGLLQIKKMNLKPLD